MIIVVDPVYNPNFIDPSNIASDTKLGPGIAISKYLGSYGDRTSFTFVTTPAERAQIARNLYMQSQIWQVINGNTELFNDIRLIVSEGVYRPGPTETVGGDNLLKQKGQLAVYQVVDREGKIDHEKTYDVAEFIKDYMFYDKIVLDYDTFNTDGSMTSQIMIYMPQVPESFDVKFGLNVSTQYNRKLISNDELVEVLTNADPQQEAVIYGA